MENNTRLFSCIMAKILVIQECPLELMETAIAENLYRVMTGKKIYGIRRGDDLSQWETLQRIAMRDPKGFKRAVYQTSYGPLLRRHMADKKMYSIFGRLWREVECTSNAFLGKLKII